MVDKNLIDELKEIFVTKDECDDINDKLKATMHSDDIRLSVIENQLKNITKLLWLVVGGVVIVIVNSWFGIT